MGISLATTVRRWPHLVLVGAVVAAGTVASCGGRGDDDSSDGGDDTGDLSISPSDPSITIDPVTDIPPVEFDVTRDGEPADADWVVDRRDLAQIDSDGTLTPTGRGAGVVTVTATVNGAEITTTVTITIDSIQNGPSPDTAGAEPGVGTPADYEPGPGGFMGVGGEGIGGSVTDEQAAVLGSEPRSDSALRLLYPYDGTVWPLGMLAPLLMWDASETEQADAILISLEAEGFHYQGTFGRPPALDSGAPFVRHPIPNDVWQAATRSAAGSTLTMNLTVARDGQAYGPVTATWRVAEGDLLGCIYYQSYFTNLVDNYSGALGPNSRFGAATLGIRPGGTDPVLVAGFDSADDRDGCRVCHSVSSDGSRMVVQHGDEYSASSSIDLQGGYAENPYPGDTNGSLGWIGMTPDGELGLGNGLPIPGGASSGPSQLRDMQTGEPVASSGLEELVTDAGLPAFSQDGSRVVFNFWSGPGDANLGEGDGMKLVTMDFERSTLTFSNPSLIYEGDNHPGWPTFLPGAVGVVFQVELSPSNDPFDQGGVFATRQGATGELWWTHLGTGQAVRLDHANGEGHTPTGPNGHGDDTILNFEPTVSPVSSGGFAWVVFMSRRLYGNVITADPYASDPRSVDLTRDYSPKKLWIAAIDLDPEPGTDPSYPAIYLPAQEIQASNSRGFWTSDPCVYTGQM